MASPEELRAESHRLREAAGQVSEPQVKQELAERALALAERAEMLAHSEDPEITRANIKRYQALLAAGFVDDAQKRVIEEMLADAQNLLANFSKRTGLR